MQSLLDRVHQALRRSTGLAKGERLLLAVSGGCDSMVLLQVMHELAAQEGWRLKVAHLNHQLRGRQSARDAALVRRVCAQLTLPCVVGQGQVKAHAQHHGRSLEMAARELRHRFLARTARQARCRWVLTAHHADDQAELVLLRLLRGSGAEGLSGMGECDPSPVDARAQIVRPLLAVTRSELRTHARAHGIRFREDASNQSMDHLRNRVRRELLPLLRRRYQPAADRVLCRLAEIMRSEDEILAAQAARWLRGKRPSFNRLPLALRRRVVLLQARALGLELEFEAVERLLHTGGEIVNVTTNRFVRRTQDGTLELATPRRLRFKTGTRVVLLDGGPSEVAFGGLTLAFRVGARRSPQHPRHTAGRERFDADAVGGRVVLRHWRAGDRFQPIGMKTAVKLQDLFTNLKVPTAERRRRVVAEAESGEVFWVEGLRIGERFKLTPATRRQLTWAWQKA
jgi:tRNA(Ile)-lysidine synthase